MEGVQKMRLVIFMLTVLISLGLTGCKNKKSNSGNSQGVHDQSVCDGDDCDKYEADSDEPEAEPEAESDGNNDVSTEGSAQAPVRSIRPQPRPEGHNRRQRPRDEAPTGNVNVIYYDELSNEAKRRLQVVMDFVDSSRPSLKVMAQKRTRSGEAVRYQRTDSHGNRFSKKIISEVYNSHGCSVSQEGYCLVIENNKIGVMGVAMGRGLTQVLSAKFTQNTREMDVFVNRLRNQRVVISQFSHRGTNERLSRQGAGLDGNPRRQGFRITGICGIEGRLNMQDKGALIVGNMKGTTQATPQFPEQYARISCLPFGKDPIRPLRVIIDIEGGWLGVKLQFSAWFKGRDVSYDQWDFGATGLGVISGPIGLLNRPGTSYGLIDVSADLLFGSIAPIGTGIFAQKNPNGPNTFVIPFYIKGENGIGDIGAQIEAYSLRLRPHPDEF